MTSAPSLTSRVLGFAGIAAGLAILAAFVIELPSGLFPSPQPYRPCSQSTSTSKPGAARPSS